MIEVYKTNVQTKQQAKKITRLLKHTYSAARINFDLQDRDRILRVEGIELIDIAEVMNKLNRSGFRCEILN